MILTVKILGDFGWKFKPVHDVEMKPWKARLSCSLNALPLDKTGEHANSSPPDKRMGVCIILRICRVSNEDEMLIIMLPQNPFAYIGIVITRWFWGAKWFVSVLAPHLHVSIYCFLIGSFGLRDWSSLCNLSFNWLFSLSVWCRVCNCMFSVFSDRRTTSTCSCV